MTQPDEYKHDGHERETPVEAAPDAPRGLRRLMGRFGIREAIGMNETEAVRPKGYKLKTSLADGHEPYPVLEHAPRGRSTLRGEQAEAAARDNLAAIFPDRSINLLSDDGSSAILFGDETLAYKYYGDALTYDYVEKEMAILTELQEEGLTPRPHVLLDTAIEERYSQAHKLNKSDIASTPIVRGTSKRPLSRPVIVMDRIDAGGLDELPSTHIAAEFSRINDVVQRHRLDLSDVEFVHDRADGSVKMLDVAGIDRATEEQSPADLAKEVFDYLTETHHITTSEMESLLLAGDAALTAAVAQTIDRQRAGEFKPKSDWPY